MTDYKTKKRGPYPSAQEGAETSKQRMGTAQESSPSYDLAFQDNQFLLRNELRPIRVQLEMLKPEILLEENNIESTVVFFGSSRISDPNTAQKDVDDLRLKAEKNPGDTNLALELKKSEQRLKNSRYYEEARKLGHLICQNTEENKLVIMTGAGQGIMEAANRAAQDTGGISIGMNILLPRYQKPNNYITPQLCFQFHYFAIRKMHFLLRAKTLVFFPGGFGTLDELFETLALLQTGKISQIPLLLFGRPFWNRVIDFETLVQEGMISEEDLNFIQYVETAEEAWKIISDFNNI